MRFIVLVGPKHSGKTCTGKALALLLSCGFADLDELIMERSGKSPRALYIEGPELFRQAEAEALKYLLNRDTAQPLVLAAGGGLADNPATLALLNQNASAVVVFLDVSVQTAWDRITRTGELPPFLKTADPRKTHRSLHERRAAAYRQLASLVIAVDGKSPGEIAGEILDILS